MAVITSLGVPDSANNTTTIMPKLAYRFRVTFIGDGFSPTPTRSVISVSRPALTHEEVIVESYNSKIYLAGKHTWDPVSIVLRDDVDSAVIRELNNQLNRQVDHAQQSSPRAGSAYKFQVAVESLDGGSPEPGVLDRFELAGCYISNIQYGDMNYGDSSQVQITVQIRYDNAEIYDAAGNPTLTGAGQDQTLSNATGGGTQA
jgi:hypothetical protein